MLAYGGKGALGDGDEVRVLAPMRFGHSNMGGFFAGDLGQHRGWGIVQWDAIWDDDWHYAPHRYQVTRYRWNGHALVGPTVMTTRRKFEPDPNAVAKALGWPVDRTSPDKFTGGC